MEKKLNSLEVIIEERLVTAYKKIRGNARNGLAVVPVERDACGGCFNKIPPQRQLDIASRKKIIVCEYCGRILVDSQINEANK
jgi:predicted  nucleic acid-binding Zn-ribbon protein